MDVATGDPDADRVPDLKALIQQHLDRTGDSAAALAAKMGGHRQTVSTWFGGQIRTWPRPDTLQAFANVTGYDLALVVLATARTMGLPVSGPSALASALPTAARQLTAQQQRAIISVIEAMNPPQPVEDAPTRSNVTDFPRRRYLSEAGEAARQGDPADPSDPDGNLLD